MRQAKLSCGVCNSHFETEGQDLSVALDITEFHNRHKICREKFRPKFDVQTDPSVPPNEIHIVSNGRTQAIITVEEQVDLPFADEVARPLD